MLNLMVVSRLKLFCLAPQQQDLAAVLSDRKINLPYQGILI